MLRLIFRNSKTNGFILKVKTIDLIYHRSTYSGSVGSAQSDFELRTTLISQLSASEQRISSLESELRAAQLARGRAEQTVFDVNAEKLRLEAQNSEILQVNISRWSCLLPVLFNMI